MVTLPKTIDNDLWGTDMTFGFQSAVDIATQCIDQIHTTAASHGRVFIVEVMGHKVGFLTLNAGIAGGADIILIPEIPYDIDKIISDWHDRKLLNSEDVKNYLLEFKNKSKQIKELEKKTGYQNYDQRDIDNFDKFYANN